MKEYELWLDESGEFKNDREEIKKINYNPSLIGGILFNKKDFSENQAQKLIGEERIHSNKENLNVVFEKFKEIAERAVTLVEISNDECISVIDSNLTYQNIMAEGLIQVLSKLKESNGNRNIKLNILIAQRGDCTEENKNNKVVTPEQYKARIIERMILEGYKKDISESLWEINIADARSDQRLMIADIICNSFLTRNTKFRGDKGDYINAIHDDENRTWRFSVFEHSLETTINQLLLEGRLGEAVIALCQSQNKQYIMKKMSDISSFMENRGYEDIHLQFMIISSRITHYTKIERKYSECLALLDNMLKYWIPVVKDLDTNWSREIAEIMELDFYIQKYTIYTHQGSLKKTKECEEHCEKLFEVKRKMNVESLEYLLMYTNRKITNIIYLFDFEGALKDSNNLVERCEKISEALSLSDEGIISFDELGKALGTRAQIHMFMIRKKSDAYQLAQEDIKKAMEEFKNPSDIRRQQIYLTQIHTEAKEYDKALETLCESSCDLQKCLKNAETNPFEAYAYIRLMSEGKRNGWEKADVMYQELNKTQIISDLKKIQELEHPYEVIFWKLGSYYAHCERSQKAALDCFSEALKCDKEERLTISVICFAAELERYALAMKEDLSERKNYQKKLKKHFKTFRNENVPDSIQDLYKNIDFEKKDWHYFDQLSRKITY